MKNWKSTVSDEFSFQELLQGKDFIPLFSEVLSEGYAQSPWVSSFRDKTFENDSCSFTVKDWNEILSKLTQANVTSVGALCIFNNQIVLVQNQR